jgi:hypothetical protein
MLKVGDQESETVREFKYIEFTLTKDNNITVEIKQNCNGKLSKL